MLTFRRLGEELEKWLNIWIIKTGSLEKMEFMFQQLKLKEININLQEFVKELLIPDNIESLFWLDHNLITRNRQLKLQILQLIKIL